VLVGRAIKCKPRITKINNNDTPDDADYLADNFEEIPVNI
jgi:hypothetical protein